MICAVCGLPIMVDHPFGFGAALQFEVTVTTRHATLRKGWFCTGIHHITSAGSTVNVAPSSPQSYQARAMQAARERARQPVPSVFADAFGDGDLNPKKKEAGQ